ncbi:MAG: DNA cytosine methyltransferase [Chloroflexi bacterium]|nr:DNA cytosine methyltransferase [Chloroflexota bacterium]MYE40227.1 DNA cytosine methyltransferase [Chloroflexota bacterium]
MTTEQSTGLGSKMDETMAALLRPSFSYSGGALKMADIYPGLGGASLAAKNLGIGVVFVVEGELYLHQVYDANFGTTPIQEMPLHIDEETPEVDIVTIQLSHQYSHSDEMLLDKVWRFQQAARFLRVRQPKAVILDIPHFARAEVVERELDSIGYVVVRGLVGERQFIVGSYHSIPIGWPLVTGCLVETTPEGWPLTVDDILSQRGFPGNWDVSVDTEFATDLLHETSPVYVTQSILSQIANYIRPQLR